MNKGSRIYIAGHTGLLGSALIRRLGQCGYSLSALPKHDLNLLNQYDVQKFFKTFHPDYVFLAAAKVGNIAENIRHPVEFLEENLFIQQNVMRAAYEVGVKKLLFFGSNCCYPRECPQPMKEEYLMTGLLEPTNQAYATAKLAGIEMCRSYNKQYGTNFIVAIPASIYGENDHFEHGRAHVLPDMIKKFHNAMMSELLEVVLWGDGSSRREFIYVDDVADASVFLMDNFNPTKKEVEKGEGLINVGSGVDHTIAELAEMVKIVVEYKGKISWDRSKPNGMPKKLLDSSRLRLMGWRTKVDILEGIRRTYQSYIKDIKQI